MPDRRGFLLVVASVLLASAIINISKLIGGNSWPMITAMIMIGFDGWTRGQN